MLGLRCRWMRGQLAEDERLAWLDAHAGEVEARADAGEGRFDQVELACGDAAGDEQQIGLYRLGLSGSPFRSAVHLRRRWSHFTGHRLGSGVTGSNAFRLIAGWHDFAASVHTMDLWQGTAKRIFGRVRVIPTAAFAALANSAI